MPTNTGACPKCGRIYPYTTTVCTNCHTRLPWADAMDVLNTPAPSLTTWSQTGTPLPTQLPSSQQTYNPGPGPIGGTSTKSPRRWLGPLTFFGYLAVRILLGTLGHSSYGTSSTSSYSYTGGSPSPPYTPMTVPTYTPPPMPTPPQVAGNVLSATAGSDMRTNPFHINSSQWTVTWATTANRISGNFAVLVYSREGTLIDMPVNVIGANSGSATMKGPGDYYLDIKSDQSWSVGVSQGAPASVAPSAPAVPTVPAATAQPTVN